MLFFVVVTLLLFPNEGEFRDKAILKRNLSNELRRPFTGVIVREPGLSQRGVQVSLLFVPPIIAQAMLPNTISHTLTESSHMRKEFREGGPVRSFISCLKQRRVTRKKPDSIQARGCLGVVLRGSFQSCLVT